MKQVVLFFCLSIMLISCESSSDKTEAIDTKKEEKISKNKSSEGLKETIENQTLVGSIFESHFDEKEQSALLAIKKEFDKGMSEGSVEQSIEKSYEFYCWSIRSNLFDQLPLKSSFPYNGKFQLDSVLVSQNLKSIWTNKCGFQKEDNEILNFFCLDVNAKVLDYFKILALKNKVIQSFTEQYIKTKSISPNDVQSYVMNDLEALDFSNVDHQIFHMIFHSTFNEEQIAINKVNAILSH